MSNRTSTNSYLPVVLLLFVTFTTGVSCLENCGKVDSVGKVVSFKVDGCDLEKPDPCQLTRGKNASMTMEFESNQQLNSAKIVVDGVFGAVKIGFPIKPDQVCGNYGIVCPIEVKKTISLNLNIQVKPTYPKVSLGILFQLVNEDSKNIVCVQFPAKIVDAS